MKKAKGAYKKGIGTINPSDKRDAGAVNGRAAKRTRR